jgi:DNA-binding GntR family transcriptional regulator
MAPQLASSAVPAASRHPAGTSAATPSGAAAISEPIGAERGRDVPTLADQAYAGLRDEIVRLRLHPGTSLIEEVLMAQLDVGRTPLREALKRLENERLVVIYPRRGTFVTEVNLTDHSLISDVRRQLEGLAAERAATRAGEAERLALAELVTDIASHPGGRTAGLELDTRVHHSVYRAARNPYLEADLTNYYNLSLRIWYLFLDRLPEVDPEAEHRPILDAVLAGDALRAGQCARDHVDHFEQAVRAVL